MIATTAAQVVTLMGLNFLIRQMYADICVAGLRGISTEELYQRVSAYASREAYQEIIRQMVAAELVTLRFDILRRT